MIFAPQRPSGQLNENLGFLATKCNSHHVIIKSEMVRSFFEEEKPVKQARTFRIQLKVTLKLRKTLECPTSVP